MIGSGGFFGLTSVASSLPSVAAVPVVRKGHTLVSNIRPYFKKLWFAQFDGGRSADVLGFVSLNDTHQEYLYNILYQDAFFDYMMRTSKGVKMPRGDKAAIMEFELVIPSQEIRKLFSETVRDFYKQIRVMEVENDSLQQTRDALLPKLLSGEIL